MFVSLVFYDYLLQVSLSLMKGQFLLELLPALAFEAARWNQSQVFLDFIRGHHERFDLARNLTIILLVLIIDI